jgi:CheY-like chemotaxis protein
MSHEIRTPINAIVGMAQIANSSEHIPKIKDCLKKIINGSNHLLGIINDILDFSKLESGKLSLNEQPFFITEDMDFINSMFKTKAEEKSLDFKVVVSNIKHDCLTTDKLRLNQVLINLLSNAFKFTPEKGTITIAVEELFFQSDEGSYRFTISDTGIGIEPDQAKKLFTPFTQANAKISTSFGGTGLGLVISKNIVQMMGGDIELDTIPGKGTTFSFVIRVKAKEAEVGQTQLAATDAVPDFAGKRILIVDDIEINREICTELLLETGVIMDTAENGLEAFNKYFNSNENFYDMILMDMQMPVMDGCEAAEKIRSSRREDAKAIDIVAMTANVMPEEIQQTRRAGMNGYISKPVDRLDMFRVMRTLFETQQT